LELVERLASELDMEKDMRDAEAYTENIKEFLDNTPFKVLMLIIE